MGTADRDFAGKLDDLPCPDCAVPVLHWRVTECPMTGRALLVVTCQSAVCNFETSEQGLGRWMPGHRADFSGRSFVSDEPAN